MDISERQERILTCIRQSLKERGYPPSIREIGRASGLRSPATVHAHLKRLEEIGLLRRDQNRSRGIELSHRPRTVALPVIGDVPAGQPVLALQLPAEELAMPATLFEDGDFMLRVKGQSMIGAGIFDGDLVVVARSQHADDGDIVVAMVGDEATVKRLRRGVDGRPWLYPENPAFDPLAPSELQLLGRVVGLIRRFA